MYNAQSGDGPLYVLNSSNKPVNGATPNGRWLLTSGLDILDGVTLYVHGTSAGGDADVLRIEVGTYGCAEASGVVGKRNYACCGPRALNWITFSDARGRMQIL